MTEHPVWFMASPFCNPQEGEAHKAALEAKGLTVVAGPTFEQHPLDPIKNTWRFDVQVAGKD